MTAVGAIRRTFCLNGTIPALVASSAQEPFANTSCVQVIMRYPFPFLCVFGNLVQ